MSGITRPGDTILGTAVDPASPAGVIIDPYTEIAGSPLLNEVIKGDGLGGWTIGSSPFVGLTYRGLWDAATNTPALVSSTGTQGDYYIVSVAGTTNLDGISTWTVGDWAIFNGTIWQKIDNDARTDYGALAADPTGGPFSNGDIYYNTVLDMEMRYDAPRAKWLSVGYTDYFFGRQVDTAPGSYFRTPARVTMNATRGFNAPNNGTILAITYTRADADAATIQVDDDGVSAAILATSAVKGKVTNLNVNFAADSVLSVLNQSGGATVTNLSGFVRVRWRA